MELDIRAFTAALVAALDKDGLVIVKKDAIPDLLTRIAALEEALGELTNLMDDVAAGKYKPDSFTTQPARAAFKGGE